MSYLDAYYDRKNDKMFVAEIINKKIVTKKVPVEHVFYYESPSGMNRSIYGHACKKFSTFDIKKFRYEIEQKQNANIRIFESDIKPEFRFLEDNYKGVLAPELNICFFDIETDMNVNQKHAPIKSLYAPTDNPYCPITAITLFNTYMQSLVSLVLCPSTLSVKDAADICNKFDNTILFTDEKELLKTFLILIEDVHVFTGWNSEGYDIPYTINRIERVLGKEETKKFCLFDQYPKPREYKKFGKIFKTYDLIGRVHLDYLILYQKYNPKQQSSYKLDYIGEMEVGEKKVQYEGNLDTLYNNDFEKFIAYNRQDVGIIIKIDSKRRYINMSNQTAHESCIQFKTTIGSVALVEQSIINDMHVMGYVVPNRPPRSNNYLAEFDDEDDSPVVGAYVAKPRSGLFRHIGCGDINSLYPSTLRALNMSPETLAGQIRLTATNKLIDDRIATGVKRADAWEGVFIAVEVQQMLDQTDDLLVVDFEDKLTDKINTYEIKAKDLYEYIFNENSNLCISANGTIFNTEKDGIIPQLLTKWYAERKEAQALETMYEELVHGLVIDDELVEMLNG